MHCSVFDIHRHIRPWNKGVRPCNMTKQTLWKHTQTWHPFMVYLTQIKLARITLLVPWWIHTCIGRLPTQSTKVPFLTDILCPPTFTLDLEQHTVSRSFLQKNVVSSHQNSKRLPQDTPGETASCRWVPHWRSPCTHQLADDTTPCQDE